MCHRATPRQFRYYTHTARGHQSLDTRYEPAVSKRVLLMMVIPARVTYKGSAPVLVAINLRFMLLNGQCYCRRCIHVTVACIAVNPSVARCIYNAQLKSYVITYRTT